MGQTVGTIRDHQKEKIMGSQDEHRNPGLSWKDSILKHKAEVREWQIRTCLRIMAAEGEWVHLEHLRDFVADLVQRGMVDLDDGADHLTPEMFGDDHA